MAPCRAEVDVNLVVKEIPDIVEPEDKYDEVVEEAVESLLFLVVAPAFSDFVLLLLDRRLV